jgi:hypothetical protein
MNTQHFLIGSVLQHITVIDADFFIIGTSIASKYRIRNGIMMRYGYGNISSRHRTSTDILFIKDGKPEIIFSNVRDAQDVVKLVKSIIQQRLQHQ